MQQIGESIITMDTRELAGAVRYLTTGTYEPGMNGGEKRKMRRYRTMFFYREIIENDKTIGRLYLLPKEGADANPENCPTVLVKNGHDPAPMSVIDSAHVDDDCHFSFEDTLKRVLKSWWWPRCQEEIRDYVRRCDRCNPNNFNTSASDADKGKNQTSTSSGRSHKRKGQAGCDLPTMVVSVRKQVNNLTDSPAAPDEHRGVGEEENTPVDGMSSSGSVSDKVRPGEEEDEIEDEGGGGGMVASDEHGRVTIVIPSAASPSQAQSPGNQDTDSIHTPPEEPANVPRSTVCRECGAVITNTNNMVVHMRRHLQYRPYHCDICDYQGYDPDDVRRHAARLHPSSVSCKVNYRPKIDLEAQLREMIVSSKTIGGSGEIDYSDTNPDQVTIDAKHQTSDLAFYSALGSRLQTNWAAPEENSDELTCNLCNTSVLHSPVPLLRHLKSHFAFDGYLCPYCTINPASSNHSSVMAYRSLRDFETHLQSSVHKTHPTVSKLQLTLDRTRRFLCDQMTHFVEHSFPDAKIKCHLCSRNIAWRRQPLSDHLREHSGYYPYKCSLCQTPFVDLPALVEHIQRDHHCQNNGEQEATSDHQGNHGSVIRYCPDAKAETDAHATFSKCFPVLTSEYIENLDYDRSSSIPVFDTAHKRASPIRSPAVASINYHQLASTENAPADAPAAPTVTNRSTLRCQMCQAQISRNMSCLIAHAKVHLAYKPLKCDHCNFRHFAMSKIRRHNARVHGSKPVKVSYHPVPDIGRQIKEMKWQCFGACGGGGSPSAAIGQVQSSAVDDPVLIEDEEIRALNEETAGERKEQREKPLQVSDILKEMIAVSSRHPPPNGDPSAMGSSTDQSSAQSSSVVSSLSSLLAERMAAAYEDALPKCRNLHSVQNRDPGFDQPIGNGLGKKLCILCNAFIANNPSSFENHACKHLDYKPYSCHYCQYQSYIRGKVTRHIQQVHSGEQVKISHKPIPGIRDRIQAVKLACFPFLAALMNGEDAANAKIKGQSRTDYEKREPLSPFINCQLCTTNVPNAPDALEAHMVDVHMPSKVYCCVACRNETPQLWKAKQHAAGAHAPDVSRYLTCPAANGEGGDPMKALHLLRLTCYGVTRMPDGEGSDQGSEGKMEMDADMDNAPLPVEEFRGDQEDSEGDEGHKRTDLLLIQRCRMCEEMVASRLDAIEDHVKSVHAGLVSHAAGFQSLNYWKICFPAFEPSELEGNSCRQDRTTPSCWYGNTKEGDWRLGTDHFTKPNDFGRQAAVTPSAPAATTTSSTGMLRKLICKLCNSTIADNPKSVGIHVKNHLNYKPYRCPFCRYMSCEQSKARRHVEHVHNANGDTIEIHAQENIKERITEMKSRCFPNLGHMSLSEVYGNGDDAGTTGSCSPEYPAGNGNGAAAATSSTCAQETGQWTGGQTGASSIFPTIKPPMGGQLGQGDGFLLGNPFMSSYHCHVCKMNNIRLEDTNAHAQTHLATGLYQSQQQPGKPSKPYQCSYCGVRFGSDEKVCAHMANQHSTLPPKYVYQPESLVDPEQLMAMKKRCFPELFTNYLSDLLIPTGSGAGTVEGAAAMAAMRGFLTGKQSGFETADDDQPLSQIKRDTAPNCLSSLYQKSMQECDGVGLATSLMRTSSLAATSKISTPVDGRLLCQICDQAVSMNPNSLDVHVKNHLDFKPHSCPYCDYKSCIAGKVKRHLDNVHKGRPTRVDSFTKSSNTLKQIIADMRTACFPAMEGDYRTKTSLELSLTVESLRAQLTRELAILRELEDDEQSGQCNLRIETSPAHDRNSQMFSPPLSKPGTTKSYSPGGEGNRATDTPALETSLDEDLLSNCGTDTQSDSGVGTGNTSASFVGGAVSYGKLPCALCGALVADNPSSLGLHVRNHLDYKPFHCLLCDYKSCIQAKVKRHLRNVHKCPTDEMTYNPVANIRAKVTEMKYQCFPRETDASSSGRSSSMVVVRNTFERAGDAASSGNANACTEDNDDKDEEDNLSIFGKRRMGDREGDDSAQQWESDGEESGRNDLEQLAAIFTGLDDDNNDGSSARSYVECQICGERVTGDELSKTKHLTRHLGDYEYRCQYCDYTSFVQAETIKHVGVYHPKQPVKFSRSTPSGEKMSTAYERLSEQCFSVEGGLKTQKKNREYVICLLCDSSVAGDKELLLAHAADHVHRLHYKCTQCQLMHADEARIKDHMRDDHHIAYESPLKMEPGENDKTQEEFYSICFPNKATTYAAFLMGDAAAGESDGLEMEEEMEGDEEEEADETEQAYKSTSTKIGPTNTPDGPRYICHLCKTPVSMYASSLYVHVKNHMNYKPYSCSHCDYKSPVKSKVRRHIQNAHKGQGADMRYSPDAVVEQEVLHWKKRCFPELSAVSTTSNDKVSCNICQVDVADTMLSKSVHAKNHLDSKPYYCPYCPYKSCLRGETRRHLVRQHPGSAIDVRFKPTDVARQADVVAMIERCFASNVDNPNTAIAQESESTTTASGSAKRKAQGSVAAPPAKKERKQSDGGKEQEAVQQQRCSVYNLRANRSSVSSSSGMKSSTRKESTDDSVKLGPAYRDWYCYYCAYKAHSKYVVKQHCLSEHPGKPVEVSEANRFST